MEMEMLKFQVTVTVWALPAYCFQGFYSKVREVTLEEMTEIESLEFNVNQYRSSIGVPQLKEEENSEKLFVRKWCRPSLSIHGKKRKF